MIEEDEDVSERRTAAEVDCALMNTILCMSFHPDELANWARAAGVELNVDPTDPDAGWGVYVHVHQAVHQGSRVAEVITQALDCVHRRAIDELAWAGVRSFADSLLHGDPRRVRDLPGRLWALATSDEDGAADAAYWAGARLGMFALQEIARAAELGPNTKEV